MLGQCMTCRFAVMAQRNDPKTGKTILDPHFRVCRRFPPIVCVIPSPNGPTPQPLNPVVASSFWCGEYQSSGAEMVIPGEKKPGAEEAAAKPS